MAGDVLHFAGGHVGGAFVPDDTEAFTATEGDGNERTFF